MLAQSNIARIDWKVASYRLIPRRTDVSINNHEDESFRRRRPASLATRLSRYLPYVYQLPARNDVVIVRLTADRCGPAMRYPITRSDFPPIK